MTIILLSVIGILVLLGFIIVRNLVLRTEKQEDLLIQQTNFILQLKNKINESDIKLNEIDEKGSFKSDDEIGWFFDNIKEIQVELNNFKHD